MQFLPWLWFREIRVVIRDAPRDDEWRPAARSRYSAAHDGELGQAIGGGTLRLDVPAGD